MSIIIYIMLFIFLCCAGRVALKFYSLYRKLHDVTRQFRDFSNGQAQGWDQRQQSTWQGGNAGGSQQAKTSTTPTGEVIEDRRTEDEINRKIFTQEEGEYVDFEEEK